MNRFSKIDSQGRALPADATQWEAVYDATTGLMWSAKNVVENELDHENATKACEGLTLASANDWRLPTVDELFALADRTRYSPAIDTAFFPSCQRDWYWTSTAAAWSSSAAWVVSFGYGVAYSGARDYTCFVRAVRSVSAAPAGQ